MARSTDGPELLEETRVPGDEEVVPHSGRHVGTDVGVEAWLFDLAVGQVVGVPGAIGALGRPQPFIGAVRLVAGPRRP